MSETKSQPKKVATPKWNLSQDDYIELLKSIEFNAKTINALLTDVKRIKVRLGIQ